MRSLAILMLAAFGAYLQGQAVPAEAAPSKSAAMQAADDEAWAKVQKLLSGVELRVFETGRSKPRTVILDEARPQALVVVFDGAQRAIARESIDRIELRLTGGSKRTTASVKSDLQKAPNSEPNRTTTGGVTMRSQENNYLLVYRRVVL